MFYPIYYFFNYFCVCLNYFEKIIEMKKLCFTVLIFCLSFVACKEDNSYAILEQKRELQKREQIFNTINKSWLFVVPQMQPEAQNLVNDWKEWRIFIMELNQKPKSSLREFQKKSKSLTKLSEQLSTTIPKKILNPAVKSRINVMKTQLKSLELYINLQSIPADKVVKLFPEINTAIASLELQFEEIIRRDAIPIEKGEADRIKIQDTTRALHKMKGF